MKVGTERPKISPLAPSASAPSAGQARVISPQSERMRPRIAGSDALCASVCTLIPCTLAIAPISAAQSTPKGNQPVAAKPAVAPACSRIASTASRVVPASLPRAATISPETSAPTPKAAVSTASASAPPPKMRST